MPCGMWDLRGSKLHTLQWKHRFLTIGLPGVSRLLSLMKPTMNTSMHYWLKYNLKYSLWEKIWKYQGKVKIYTYIYPALVLLTIYPANSKIHKTTKIYPQGTGKHFFPVPSTTIVHALSVRLISYPPKAACDPKLNHQRITFHDHSNRSREKLMNHSLLNRVILTNFAWGNRRQCLSFLQVSWDKTPSLKLLAAILPS